MIARLFATATALGLIALSVSATSASTQAFKSEAGPIEVVTVARGLEHPWASPSCRTGGCW